MLLTVPAPIFSSKGQISILIQAPVYKLLFTRGESGMGHAIVIPLTQTQVCIIGGGKA